MVIDDAGIEGVQDYAAEYGIDLTPSTPNLTALAASGVRFRRCYTNSVCSATRALLTTGRYAFRTGVGNNCTATANGPPNATEPWLASLLDATHTTAVIGKWHLGTLNNGQFLSALKTGSGGVAQFDRWQGTFGNILGNNTYWFWPRFRDGVLYDLTGEQKLIGFDSNGAPAPIGAASGVTNRDPRNYATTVIVNDAIDWIGAQGGDWLCMVAFNAPHEPLHQPPTLAERTQVSLPTRLMTALMENVTTAYIEIDAAVDVEANQAYLDSVGWPSGLDTLADASARAAYCASIECMDTELGRLLADVNVDQPDVTVWFVSDNGAASLIVPGAKNTPNENGLRVPMIVAGNGVSGTGVCDRLVQTVDIWRTILAMEGIDDADIASAFPTKTVDGVDISTLFSNVLNPAPRTFAYCERFEASPRNPDGEILDIEDGSTGDASVPYIENWLRSYEDGAYLLVERNVYDATTHERTVTYELYNVKGSDPFGLTDLLLDQDLDFDSVNRNTAHWRGLQRCLTGLAALNP